MKFKRPCSGCGVMDTFEMDDELAAEFLPEERKEFRGRCPECTAKDEKEFAEMMREPCTQETVYVQDRRVTCPFCKKSMRLGYWDFGWGIISDAGNCGHLLVVEDDGQWVTFDKKGVPK